MEKYTYATIFLVTLLAGVAIGLSIATYYQSRTAAVTTMMWFDLFKKQQMQKQLPPPNHVMPWEETSMIDITDFRSRINETRLRELMHYNPNLTNATKKLIAVSNKYEQALKEAIKQEIIAVMKETNGSFDKFGSIGILCSECEYVEYELCKYCWCKTWFGYPIAVVRCRDNF